MAAILPSENLFAAANHATIDIDEEFEGRFEDQLVMKADSPTDLEFSPDGKYLFVTQKEGRVFYTTVDELDSGDDVEPKLVFDVNVNYDLCFDGARGLSGIGVHPDFPATPWIYLFHNYNKHGDCNANVEKDGDEGPVNRLSRYVIDTSSMKIDPDSELVLFETPPLYSSSHNSGDIAFGKDGKLYITVGDAGTRVKENSAGVTMPQALDRLVGKIIRLNDDGSIPSDNPYTGADSTRCRASGLSGNPMIKCQEIWATGLRNPYRFAFNPNVEHTQFYINEVGRNMWERILPGGDDFKGANYGFPFRQGMCDTGKTEGSSCQPSEFDDAIHWYRHDEEDGGACTGGAFYPNDAGWPADFQDGYFYAEYAYGGINRISPGGKECAYPKCDPPVSAFSPTMKTFSPTKKVVSLQFGPHKGGKALYYMTRGDTGTKGDTGLFRIAYTGSNNRNPKAFIEAENTVGFAPLTVTFDGTGSYDPDGDQITFEWDFQGDGTVDSTEPKPTFVFTGPGTFYAKLVVKDGKGGSAKTTIRIDADNTPPLPKIISPKPSDTFAVGDIFKLVGSAFDPEDGDLPDTALTWEVRQHHNYHYHPFLDPGTPGNNFDLWPAPEPEDFDASLTSYLAIRLTATDSKGLSATTEIIVKPKVVEIELDSVPSGLTLIANGDKFITPTTITTWENHKFDIKAPLQEMNGVNFGLDFWSDGGDETHTIIVPASKPAPFIAQYGKSKPRPVISRPEKGSTFSVGDVFKLKGSATDSLGNPMDDSALTWEVKFNDGNNKEHYDFLDETSGNNVATSAVHAPEDLATAGKAYFEIFLTATDSASGESKTTSMIVYPKLVELELDTVPSGLEVEIDGEAIQTPETVFTWDKHTVNVRAKSQSMDGNTYKWSSWSNGMSRSHRYNADQDDKLVAEFEQAMPAPVISGLKDLEDSPTFKVGDVFYLSGSSKDVDGDVMSTKSLSWELRMVNNVDSTYHTITSQKGNEFAFSAPDPDTFEEAETSHLEVLLMATDSGGVSSTKTYALEPSLSDVVIDTVPSGLIILADGAQIRTPATITSWQKDSIQLEAPPQKKNGEVYAWHAWSEEDAAAPTFDYVVPRARNNGRPRTVVATFGDPALAPKIKSSSSGSNAGAIVGIAVGLVAVLGVIVAAFVVLKRRKNGGEHRIVDLRDPTDTGDPFKTVDLAVVDTSLSEVDDSGDLEGASSVAPSSVAGAIENSLLYQTPIALSKYFLSTNQDENPPADTDSGSPFSPNYSSKPQSTNPFEEVPLTGGDENESTASSNRRE
eukprot:CAMPEP_0185819140 /NCGR_PEP_ID=MMETSP1322-20130828/21759_1 /TAXON_ID=265543 /ORGANISM="Minutocellus polymorphus, Strain RCC2270" /LENGTH=1280 /DNA_ID=CAMNT_0028516321 /DNA_START=291 /DNA_END=4133 /DNA_ORIENTATION=+